MEEDFVGVVFLPPEDMANFSALFVIDKSVVAIWVKTDVERHIGKANAKSMKSQSTFNFQPVQVQFLRR